MDKNTVHGKKDLRVVVIVSPDTSDVFFANRLMDRVNVVGVVVENQQSAAPTPIGRLAKGLRYLTNPRLITGRIKEELYGKKYRRLAAGICSEGFGYDGEGVRKRDGVRIIHTSGRNDINDPINVEAVRSLSPDVIAVCGASILKGEILSIPSQGTLNLHGGLSQWYRGVWTTLWAVHNGEPEYVGCTVHYVSPGIDDGDIVYQGRPEISRGDNHESLYVKVVKLGVELMCAALEDIRLGRVRRHRLRRKGRLYLKKDVTAEVLREVWKKLDSGVIDEYLDDREKRDKKVKIYG